MKVVGCSISPYLTVCLLQHTGTACRLIAIYAQSTKHFVREAKTWISPSKSGGDLGCFAEAVVPIFTAFSPLQSSAVVALRHGRVHPVF
jgi:hypothetical protein